jgi:phenylalanyl-tRNA synthetase beta chain
MKISLEWLGEYLTWTESDPRRIAERITACTAEVDALEEQGALLKDCCVGKVLSITKHPNADKLSLCEVKTDHGKKKIVCGGINLREGMRVALAHVGARVRWHGEEMMTLEKTKIRGEESEGMICAAEELDLTSQFPDATGHDIIDMGDGDEGVGKSLKEFLGLTDTVLDIDNHAITHRPDLFSHVGFARECVALGLASWKKKPEFSAPSFSKDPAPFTSKLDAKDLISRYSACTLSIDELGETPDWMKRRLETVGLRSLNLPIDITNYVMLELGIPLHSFDMDDFKGAIHMRASKKGEHITTLDGVDRELPEGAVVISDDDGIFDLLGIMGGLRSSTKETTKHIYLHSAIVDPVAIRRTILATGHRTDAATVYEKGVPNMVALQGLHRALELFLAHVPGAKITSKLDEWGDDGVTKSIPLSPEKVSALLGTDIPEKDIQRILTDLGCLAEGKGDTLKVSPPLWRLGDLTASHDLIEEIGRIYGYDNIEEKMPAASIVPPDRDQRLHVLREALKERSFTELCPLSLLGDSLLQKCEIDTTSVEVGNPIGEETALMQPSMIPTLLDHAQRNMLNISDVLKTFHAGHVFTKDGEHTEIGALIARRTESDLKSDPFLMLKSELASALEKMGYALTFATAKKSPSFAHPGRSADVLFGKEVVGHVSEVHPTIRDRFDLPQRAAVLTLNLSDLLAHEPTPYMLEKVQQFPAVSYDCTFTLDTKVDSKVLLEKARTKSSLLKDAQIIDLYAGSPLERGQYNLTLRFTYSSPERTLSEEEAKKEHENVLTVFS